jgi:diaminohydroxyphosphoribosylaminopyrimidine deaminase/5-amino-6-(5-phosphoribosylamino)uracil reductase
LENRKFMQRALDLARLGIGRTRPNPLVGAVLVKDNKIVGEGYHRQFGGPHAEINALDMAKDAAKDSTLYVTLEPCSHHGKTPPCCDAIVESGVKRVVCAIRDPNPLVAGKGIAYLKSKGVDVSVGILANEASELNEIFLHFIKTKKPFVILKTAMSLDGKIATRTGESRWISSPQSRQQVHQLRNQVAAVVVGVNTVLKDDPVLTTRLAEGKGINPLRIVLDTTGRTPLDARLFKSIDEAPLLIVSTNRISPSRVQAYERAGAEVWIMETTGHTEMIHRFLTDLGERQVDSLLVEGGGTVAESFVTANAVDKYIGYIAPMIIGGEQAPTPVEGSGFSRLSQALRFSHVATSDSGGDIRIVAYPNREIGEAL